MGFLALNNSENEFEFIPAQQQVQDIMVEGGDGIPAKFLNPLDSAAGETSSEISGQSIPIIDIGALLGGESRLSDARAKEIEQACREWGIFQVVNHGVPSELIERVSDLASEYFQRPAEAREMDLGSTPQPKSGCRDWNDAMLHFIKPSMPDVITRRTLPDGYKEAMSEYVEEVMKITETMRRVLSVGLGLNSSRIEEAIGEPGAVVRVNYYPPCPRPDLVSGLSAHSDMSLMTVLHQNEVAGLQVRKDGQWYTVPATPNALTINVSDILQVLSNDAYVSCEHRAFVNPHSARLSVAVFISIPGDRHFAPLPELVDAEHPPLYKQVTLSEYLDSARVAGLNGKLNLASLRIPPPAAPAAAAANETFVFKFPEPTNIEPSTATGNVTVIPKLIALEA